MNNITRRIEAGDGVRITAGGLAGRAGVVKHIGGSALYVEIEAPTLLLEPDGRTVTRVLPFSRRELVALRGKHERIAMVDRTPLPDHFRPRHCAGGNSCLHMHPGDAMCSCERVVVPDGEERTLVAVAQGRTAGATVRHTVHGCGVVSAVSV